MHRQANALVKKIIDLSKNIYLHKLVRVPAGGCWRGRGNEGAEGGEGAGAPGGARAAREEGGEGGERGGWAGFREGFIELASTQYF